MIAFMIAFISSAAWRFAVETIIACCRPLPRPPNSLLFDLYSWLSCDVLLAPSSHMHKYISNPQHLPFDLLLHSILIQYPSLIVNMSDQVPTSPRQSSSADDDPETEATRTPHPTTANTNEYGYDGTGISSQPSAQAPKPHENTTSASSQPPQQSHFDTLTAAQRQTATSTLEKSGRIKAALAKLRQLPSTTHVDDERLIRIIMVA